MVEPPARSAPAGDVLIGGGERARRAQEHEGPRRRRDRLATAALVCLALVAGLMGGQRLAQRLPVAGVRALLSAYTAAWNAHDADAVVRLMTDDGTFAEGDLMQSPVVGPLHTDDFRSLLRRLSGEHVSLQTTGRAVFVGSGPYSVAVRQRVRYQVYGLQVDETGLSMFTLAAGDGGLRVAAHMFLRPYRGLQPSMLWTS